MKLAYLITAYNNPKHLNRLIEALNNKNVDFFIHIDKKSVSHFELPSYKNVHILKNNIDVFWGSFTFIQAVLLMIEKAISMKKYDYFCLISGTDYPTRSNKAIFEYFTKNNGKEFINICEMPENDKSLDRVNYFHFSTYLYKPNPIYLAKICINRFIRAFGIKRALPKEYHHLTLYGGSNWWALSAKCVAYVMQYIKDNPKLEEFYEHTYIPEEMFFHTIIGNSPFYANVKNAVTYTDWSAKTGPLPAEITKQHIQSLAKQRVDSNYGSGTMDILFARKFTDQSQDVLKEIDRKLRSNK